MAGAVQAPLPARKLRLDWLKEDAGANLYRILNSA